MDMSLQNSTEPTAPNSLNHPVSDANTRKASLTLQVQDEENGAYHTVEMDENEHASKMPLDILYGIGRMSLNTMPNPLTFVQIGQDKKLKLTTSRLAKADNYTCFYLKEYHPGEKTSANQLIWNFKKAVPTKGSATYYKQQAIKTIAQCLVASISTKCFKNTVWIPIPPSKAKTAPAYDNRLIQVLANVDTSKKVRCKEWVEQISSTRSSHTSKGNRLTESELTSNYQLSKKALSANKKFVEKKKQAPEHIIIFDDVSTTGTHFRSMARLLSEVAGLKGSKIFGVFIARTVNHNYWQNYACADSD